MRGETGALLRRSLLRVPALLTLAFGAGLAPAEEAVPAPARQGGIHVTLEPSGLAPQDLAVVINTEDPLSVAIGEYYRGRRGIADANLVRVAFIPGRSVMSREEFERVKATVDAHTPPSVQAYALTWAAPYRVECMSVTSAFALGFDEAYCASGCVRTRPSPYFNSLTDRPFDALGVRPAMSLAATSLAEARALVDRGMAADASYPRGTGYLLDTTDRARNVRAETFPQMTTYFAPWVRLEHVVADAIEGKPDVLVYFTGKVQVAGLETNTFLPGAVGDHLTSAGGQLTDSQQMSSLRWLEAGATGSYGTVVEPCAFPEKFPSPGIFLTHYLRGDTLIEAYWKSVRTPGQGIFIGEPLARPYAGTVARPVPAVPTPGS